MGPVIKGNRQERSWYRLSVAALLIAWVSALSGCGLWCNIRGGDYNVILPPDEDETRACVMPEEPAVDAGKRCTDGRECVKNCACPDEVMDRLSKLHEQGVDFDALNGEHAPMTTGSCTELTQDVGFICDVVDGKAQVDMIVI